MNRYEALKHAVKAHAGQVDKCGQPYILHPIAVAEALERNGDWVDDFVVVAYLHDVLEDTDADPTGLLTPRQSLALHAVTRKPGETYFAYIDRLSTYHRTEVREIACVVKLADIWHNTKPERQDCLPESERKGLEKRYLKARDRIWEALGYRWWPSGGGGS